MTSVEAAPRQRATALAPEQRRLAIVEATLPLLLEHGPSVTTRQIAEASGIAEGTIFRVFPDKDSLLHAVVERALDTAVVEARLGEIDLTSTTLEQRLVRAVEVLQERTNGVWQLTSNPGVMRIMAARHGRPPKVIKDLPGLVALFEGEGEALRYDAVGCARRLRAITIACTHPALAPEPLEAGEIVALFLRGVHV